VITPHDHDGEETFSPPEADKDALLQYLDAKEENEVSDDNFEMYEHYEDMYADLPKNEKIKRSASPEGSMAEYRRAVEPQRNRTVKRARELMRKLKEESTEEV
jgi:hypothetical protein